MVMALPTWGIKTPSLYHLFSVLLVANCCICPPEMFRHVWLLSQCWYREKMKIRNTRETEREEKENRAPMNLFVGDFRCRCLHCFKLLLFVQLHFWQVEELTLRGDVSGLTVPLLEDLLLASLLMEDTQWVSWNIDEQPTSSYCMTRYSYLGQIQWEILVWCLSRFAALLSDPG